MANDAAILAKLNAIETELTVANARIAALETQVQQLQEEKQQLRHVVMVALNSAVDTLVDAGRYAQAHTLSKIASDTEIAMTKIPSGGYTAVTQVPAHTCQQRRCSAPDDAGNGSAYNLGAGAQCGDPWGHPHRDAVSEHHARAPAGSVGHFAPLLRKDPELRNALIRFNWHVYAACNH